MTLAAIWLSEQRIYAVADTRLSRSPGNVLTDHGPKLLPLTISCKQPGDSGFFDREVYRTTIGYAYAGATLPALSTHSLANILCQNLIGAPNAGIPALDEIASAVAEIAVRYMRDVTQLSASGGLFSAIVFGYCARTSKFRAFELSPVVEPSPLQTRVAEHDLYVENALVIIGNRPDLLRERVSAMRQPDLHSVVAADLPRRALQSLIAQGADETVGGALQYGWATQLGFEPVAQMVPIHPPLPSGRNATLTVLGFDMEEFDHIGSYQFAMTGRA